MWKAISICQDCWAATQLNIEVCVVLTNAVNAIPHNLGVMKVVLAALFDLLTFQVDRHAQNVFIDENGKLTLIDNEQWLGSGVNSLFLPTSEVSSCKHIGTINQLKDNHTVIDLRSRQLKPGKHPNIRLDSKL